MNPTTESRNGNSKNTKTKTNPVTAPTAQLDTITILRTASHKRATKRFVKMAGTVNKEDYDAGYLFGVTQFSVRNIDDLSFLLEEIELLPDCFAIRGLPRDGLEMETGVQRNKENFISPALGHNWLMIDFDKITVPSSISLKKNKTAVFDHLISLLPPEFHDTSYHWQLSSSAGIGPAGKVSMHLWFWLEMPATDAALKVWAKDVNIATGYKLIDPALFNDVQIHYTAAPIFVGMADPFPSRSGLVIKVRDEVALNLRVKPECQSPLMKVVTAKEVPGPSRKHNAKVSRIDKIEGSGFEFFLSQIGDHPGGDGFHEPIIQAIASYVRTHGIDGTDIEKLFETVNAVVLSADASMHDSDYVDRMASRAHIIPAIEGALRKYGDKTVSHPRLHQDVEPHFKSKPQAVKKTIQQLEKLLKHGF